MLGRKETRTCPLCTVSELINGYELPEVNFLKIDVERGELDVLNGIALQDWPKIQNMVVEVHDIAERVHKVQSKLEQFGFQHIVIEETPLLEGTGLLTVYGKRAR